MPSIANPIRLSKTLLQTVLKRPAFSTPPIHLQIEPVNRCNMDCAMCRPQGRDLSSDLDAKILGQIIGEYRPMFVTFSGLGEPLLHRDLPQMISMLCERGAKVNTTTNGLLLGKRAQELIDSGVGLVNISLEAVSEAVYGELRNHKFYSTVRQGVRALAEAKRNRGTGPLIRTSFVICMQNVLEMADFLEHSKSLGAEMVLFQHLDQDDISDEAVDQPPLDLLREQLEKARQKGKELGIPNNSAALLENFSLFWGPDPAPRLARRCQIVWMSAYIASDGGIRPCCRFAANPEATLGRVGDVGWGMNGKDFMVFRKKLSQRERPHPVCRNCVPENLNELVFGRRRY